MLRLSATAQVIQDTTESRVKTMLETHSWRGRAKSHGRDTEEEEITEKFGTGYKQEGETNLQQFLCYSKRSCLTFPQREGGSKAAGETHWQNLSGMGQVGKRATATQGLINHSQRGETPWFQTTVVLRGHK